MATNNQLQTGSTTLPIAQGGTNLTSFTANQILYSSSNNTIAGIATANNGYLSTNGSGVPSISTSSVSSSNYQTHTNTSWTPADASGASLTFTINSATYTQIGNIVVVQAKVTYPSTVNTNGASWSGLPIAPNKDTNYAGFPTSFGPLTYKIPSGSTTITFVTTATGAAITNTNLSTQAVVITCMYLV